MTKGEILKLLESMAPKDHAIMLCILYDSYGVDCKTLPCRSYCVGKGCVEGILQWLIEKR